MPLKLNLLGAMEQEQDPRYITGTFDKQKSLFNSWKEDTEAGLEQCVKFDTSLINFSAFIDTPHDIARASALVEENFVKLKETYIYALSWSKQCTGIDV